jgi:hypothetical protein
VKVAKAAVAATEEPGETLAMDINRRALLTGTVAIAASASGASATADDNGIRACENGTLQAIPTPIVEHKETAVFVPGYYPGSAHLQGRKVIDHPQMMRGIRASDPHLRLLSRIGMDGSVRQAMLPAAAHDVEISPDRSIGLLCGFNKGGHVAFDPDTLDIVGRGAPLKEGWNGGGHAAFFNDSKTVLISERAPQKPLRHAIENHFGRITVREAESMRILEDYSTHGIDPHDIRLIEDGRYLVIANYGSVIDKATGDHATPRQVVEASVTIIETASGKLVDKQITNARDTELRHLAAASRDAVFAIQARLGDEPTGSITSTALGAAYEADITTKEGQAYLNAATLKLNGPERPRVEMGSRDVTELMRHGLSIKYDPLHDEVIASFPSTHRVMVFSGTTGELITMIDTSTAGLRYPCGVTLLPGDQHYAVTGYWENLFVYERSTHRLVRDLCLFPVFFGHSHIAAA